MNIDRVRFEYLKWYSTSDLDAPASRWVTSLVVLSLGMIIALLIVATTVAFWIPAIQESRLERSPLAKSLWVGQPGNQSMLLTDERLKVLTDQISGELKGRSVESVERFSRHALKFKSSAQSRGPQEWYGRTVEDNDSILLRLNPQPFSGPGIIPTRELLTWLGYDEQDQPKQLEVRFNDEHLWQAVPVPYVAEVKLPYELKYLIRRADFDAVYLKGFEPQYGRVVMAPVSRESPSGHLFSRDEVLASRCSDWGVTVNKEGPVDGSYFYVIRDANSRRKTASQWDKIVTEFRAAIGEYARTHELPDLLDGKQLTNAKKEDEQSVQVPTAEFELAEIRVQNLNDLKATARGCRKAGFPTDETLVLQLDQVHQIGRLLLIAMAAICFSLLVIAAVILFVIQYLRCELKIPEIGMLKAMGISADEFLKLFGIQARILWWRGMTLGAGGALAVTGTIALTTAISSYEIGLLGVCLTSAVIAFAVVTLGVVHISLLLATWPARMADPMDTIRLG